MADLFDYIYWRGDLTFEQSDFNQVDGMIFARLTYVPFERIIGDLPEGSTVAEASSMLLDLPEIDSLVNVRDDVSLLGAVRKSRRFGEVKLYRYENITDTATQTQFAAVTFRLNDSLSCITFRGTDNTIVGWKEDFNMAFTFPVPAQRMALRYVEDVIQSLEGSFIVCGHSKGGNLAVYSSAFCKHLLQNRIAAVYNYDGPGFDEKVLDTPGYGRICKRTDTFVPQSSIVGMLLGHKEKYVIVHSSQRSAPLQHNLYSWDIEREGFEQLETVTAGSRFLDNTIRDWLGGLDKSQLEKAADALYGIFTETNASTLRELTDNWYANAKIMLQSIKNMDPATKSIVAEMLKALMVSAKNEVMRKEFV